VKGFTEALITDLRLHAPHVKAAVVMPGHIGTGIVTNSAKIHGAPDVQEMKGNDFDAVRVRMKRMGIQADALTEDQVRDLIRQQAIDFEQNAPLTAQGAASIILDGVRDEKWRILVGDDAQAIDALVRETPEEAYELPFHLRVMKIFQEARKKRTK